MGALHKGNSCFKTGVVLSFNLKRRMEMKKVILAIVFILMVGLMSGCGENPPQTSSVTSESSSAKTQSPSSEEPDVDDTPIDEELNTCALAALSEIGIEDADLKVVSDSGNGITRDVKLETKQGDLTLTLSCFALDGEWTVISIYNKDTSQYYWADEDVKQYQDIYDWKTGEIISSKSEEIPGLESRIDKMEDDMNKIVDDAKNDLDKLQ